MHDFDPFHRSPRSSPTGSEIRLSQLLRCLTYLRGRLRPGATPVLKPFRVDPSDMGVVNRAASRVAAHANLGGLLFVVSESGLEDHVAGNIELRIGGREVFINISPAARRFGPSTLALLAHEIAHKALFEAGVKPSRLYPRKYEVLTDVAAVYLGFGKLLLNGYEYVSERPVAGGTEQRRHRFGYVTVPEVAFTHAMTITMRGLSTDGLTDGLAPFAARALTAIYNTNAYRSHVENARLLAPAEDYV